MKLKFLIVVLIGFLLGSFALNQSYDDSEKTELNNPVTIIKEDETSSSLLIGTGEICPIYEPKGEVVYNSVWTGDLPKIDKVTKEYETATFGLG